MGYTTQDVFELDQKKVESVINDFIEHLYCSGIEFYDKQDKRVYSSEFIFDNYMATFD